jgi:hypothetical protein
MTGCHKYHRESLGMETFASFLPSPNRWQRQRLKADPHLDGVIKGLIMPLLQFDMQEYFKSLSPPLLPVPQWLASELNTCRKVEIAKSIPLVRKPVPVGTTKYLGELYKPCLDGAVFYHLGPNEYEIFKDILLGDL